MMQTEYGAEELSRSECLALLPTAGFGRIVFTEGALPAVVAVAFRLDPAGIVLRTASGSSLCRAVDGAVVGFQADDVDVARRAGWTVTVVGRARVVRDLVEADRLARLPLLPWLGGDRNAFVVVDVGMVSGRRVGGAEPVPLPWRSAAPSDPAQA